MNLENFRNISYSSSGECLQINFINLCKLILSIVQFYIAKLNLILSFFLFWLQPAKWSSVDEFPSFSTFSLISFLCELKLFADIGPCELEDGHSYITTHSIHFLQPAFLDFSHHQVIILSCVINCYQIHVFGSLQYQNFLDSIFLLLWLYRTDFGKWIAFIAIVLHLLFPRHFSGMVHFC